jgi:hypothetical protein
VASEQIKTAVLCWLRFGRRYPYVCTEVGRFSADVLGATTKSITEVEVKVSKSDFRADFANKKNKHALYKNVSPRYRGAGWLPNQMYFAVPEAMKDFALEQLAAQNPRYGLMIFKDGLADIHALECVKTAQKLHTVAPSPKILENILLRMGSELTNFHIYSHRYNIWLHDMKDEARKLSGAVDVDPESHGIMEGEEKKNETVSG